MATTPTIHPADPRLRRLARWLPAAVIVAGAVALLLLQRWLDALAPRGATLDALLLAFAGLAALLASIGLALGWTLWQAAARVRREDRYPASDMRTLRDAVVVHGPAARRAAAALRVAALVAALLGAGLVAWTVLTLRGLL